MTFNCFYALSCIDMEFHHFGYGIMRLPPCSCLLVVTVLLFLWYCTSQSRRQLLYLGEPSVQGRAGAKASSEAGLVCGLRVATWRGLCAEVQDVCLGGWGWTGVVCAKTSRCVRAVRLGPVSDTPSLGGVGAAGCTIMSPWALCNYALT